MSSHSPVQPPTPPPLPTSSSHQAPPIVRPTTAGLLKFPSIVDNEQGVPAACNGFLPVNNLSSQKFKDELKEKHSRFSNANSSSTIDERIKSRKEFNGDINSNFVASSEQQLANMPDKLLSTLNRQDVRPFSYTSGVNDPNNRGKLDLNQIKSPIMRRRLLANLDSTEREDEEEDIVTSTTGDSDVFIPEAAAIKYYEPKPIEADLSNTQRLAQNTYPPVMRYNEPPQFYNLREPQNIQPSYTNGFSSPKSAIDELGDEVARSLDSLSELVANLHTSQQNGTINHRSTSSCNNNCNSLNQMKETAYHLSGQKRSTFLPGDVYNRANDFSRQTSSSPYPQLQTRSMGDYLLSPDSNYFSTSSNAQPYSISPYYGSPLDVDPYEHSFNIYSQPRPLTGRTFSPDNRGASQYSRGTPQERYY